MEVLSTYPVRIKRSLIQKVKIKDKDKDNPHCESKQISNTILDDTAAVYRKFVDFLLDVIQSNWDTLKAIVDKAEHHNANACIPVVEDLIVSNKSHPEPKFNADKVDTRFYKLPCYLRRAAIMEAYGKVSSYKNNHANWEKDPTGSKEPKPPKAGCCYPCLYRGNMFVRTGTYTAVIKVFVNNTWDWIEIELNRQDADFILKKCKGLAELAPTLTKRGKLWYLDFVLKAYPKLIDADTPASQRRIAAVDLGINNSCTCSVLMSDGTILARRFLKLAREEDSLTHELNQCH